MFPWEELIENYQKELVVLKKLLEVVSQKDLYLTVPDDKITQNIRYLAPRIFEMEKTIAEFQFYSTLLNMIKRLDLRMSELEKEMKIIRNDIDFLSNKISENT